MEYSQFKQLRVQLVYDGFVSLKSDGGAQAFPENELQWDSFSQHKFAAM